MTLGPAWQAVPCVVCGADDGRPLLRRAVCGGRARVVRCRVCGHTYLNPQPCRQHLRAAYEAGYMRRRQAGHDGSQWGYRDYLADPQGHLATFRRRLAAVERHLPRRGVLLDVGCAAGLFLQAAKERGWQTVGVEPDREAAAFARERLSLDVRTGELREASFPDQSFDLVAMQDVIEHLPNPRAELREVRRVARPNGLLLVSTMNVSSLWARLLASRWVHLKPGEHLHYFSPASLLRLLRDTGFEPIGVERGGHATTVVKVLDELGLTWASRRLTALPQIRFWLDLGEMVAYARKPPDAAVDACEGRARSGGNGPNAGTRDEHIGAEGRLQ